MPEVLSRAFYQGHAEEMSAVAIVVVVTLVAATIPPNDQSAARQAQPAPPDIELFVRQALEDLLAREKLLDGHLLSSRRIALRKEFPSARLTVSERALPERDGYEFYLITEAEAQVRADENKAPVYFIIIDRPVLAGDTATMTVGVDVLHPREPKVMKLCCCRAVGEFTRPNGRWTWVRWANVVCS